MASIFERLIVNKDGTQTLLTEEEYNAKAKAKSRLPSEDKLLSDYSQLDSQSQQRLNRFMKNLLTVQRAEKKAELDAININADISKEFKKVSEAKGIPYCAFCGRKKNSVKQLLTGYCGICICDECVSKCDAALEKAMGENWQEEYRTRK